jgi:hypothetical protein
VAGGSVTVLQSTVSGNAAVAGPGGSGSQVWRPMTTLQGPVTALGTTLRVARAAVFTVGATIRIASEQMTVTGVDTVHNVLTVIRGVNGTTVVNHPGGYVYLLVTGAAGLVGASQGGGIANDAAALALALDAFTVANDLSNSAGTDPNIHGPYTKK